MDDPTSSDERDAREEATYDEILATRDRMAELEPEVLRTLAAQKMAAGDHTHHFRASLVEFSVHG